MPAPDQLLDLQFPLHGLDVANGYYRQPPGTTPVGLNVRSFDMLTLRDRGGSRAGLSKFIPVRVPNTSLIQELNCVVIGGAQSAPPVSAQHVHNVAASNGTASPTVVLTGLANGELICLDVFVNGAAAPGTLPSISSVSDNLGSSYTFSHAYTAGAGLGYLANSYWALANGAGTCTITVNLSGVGAVKLVARSYTGVNTGTTADAHGSAFRFTAGSVSSTVVTNGTNDVSDVLFVQSSGAGLSPNAGPAGYGVWFTSNGSGDVSGIDIAVATLLDTASNFTPSCTVGTGGGNCSWNTFFANPSTLPSGRQVTLVAVAGGTVYTVNEGATSWTTPTNNTGTTPALYFPASSPPALYSSQLNTRLYFADGHNWVYLDIAAGTVNTWTASAGTLPVDGGGNKPRLICTWRGRIVLAGWLLSPSDARMSAADDGTNFDYSPAAFSATQAIIFSASPIGLVPDIITALIPFTDDLLIIGGDHTIWMLQGNPLAGGQLQLVSDITGIAWGKAWCKDPQGNIYFASNRAAVYRMTPGQPPERISQPIDPLLITLDTFANKFSLVWDDRWQGVHVFITTASGPATNTHYFFETRTNAWWQDQFADTNQDPLCCILYNGSLVGDRLAVIGSWDGAVRAFSPSSITDDSVTFSSNVLIGPIKTDLLDDMLLKDMLAVLGDTVPSSCTYKIYVGDSPEAALATSPIGSRTGTLLPGRNYLTLVRTSGRVLYIGLSGFSQGPWALEMLCIRLATRGKLLGRMKRI